MAALGSTLDDTSTQDGATDTGGNTWSDGSSLTAPIIGFARASAPYSGSGPFNSVMVGSNARACTAGDLVTGDTVTLSFTPAAPTSFGTTGMLIHVPAVFTGVSTEAPNANTAPVYGFSDTFPWFTTPTVEDTLTWMNYLGDTGTDNKPIPSLDAVVLTAMGAYPAETGFIPIDGILVGERASGLCSLACACIEAPALAAFDPGGSWPSTHPMLSGNFQLMTPTSVSSSVAFDGVTVRA
jgi:hypothetical protein